MRENVGFSLRACSTSVRGCFIGNWKLKLMECELMKCEGRDSWRWMTKSCMLERN